MELDNAEKDDLILLHNVELLERNSSYFFDESREHLDSVK